MTTTMTTMITCRLHWLKLVSHPCYFVYYAWFMMFWHYRVITYVILWFKLGEDSLICETLTLICLWALFWELALLYRGSLPPSAVLRARILSWPWKNVIRTYKCDSIHKMAYRPTIFEFALLGMAILPSNFGLENLLDSTKACCRLRRCSLRSR